MNHKLLTGDWFRTKSWSNCVRAENESAKNEIESSQLKASNVRVDKAELRVTDCTLNIGEQNSQDSVLLGAEQCDH